MKIRNEMVGEEIEIDGVFEEKGGYEIWLFSYVYV